MKNKIKDIIKKEFKKIIDFNERFAVILTASVGTMWCAYLFACLALVSLPAAIAGGIATLISWIAQTFIQLVLLSVIMVGQDIQSRKTESRDIEDHNAILGEFKEIKEIHQMLVDEIREMKEIQSELHVLHHNKAGCRFGD